MDSAVDRVADNESPELGESLLARLRRDSGLSQEDLAEAAGISVRTVRDIERRAVKRPRRDSLRRITRALRLPDETAIQFEAHYRSPSSITVDEVVASLAPAPPPAEVPRDTVDFVGRVDELRTARRVILRQPVDAPLPLLAVVGQGGIGKTTFAVHLAHHLATHFPDGQLFATLGGLRPDRITTEQILGELLRSLGVDPATIPLSAVAQGKLFRSILAGRRVLVVLDDAADASQVTELLPSRGPSAAVVTSRSPLGGLGATRTMTLGPLAPDDAQHLLAQAAGHPHNPGDELLTEIGELCGHLPLALRIVGTRLAVRPDWTTAHCLAQLRDEQNRLRELEYGSWAVTTTLGVSHQALVAAHSPADQEASHGFGRLALIPGTDFSLATAAAVLDRSQSAVDAALGRLLDVGLVEIGQHQRYRYHRLTRLFARGTLDDEAGEYRLVLERLGAYYRERLAEVVQLRRRRGEIPRQPAPLVPDSPMHWLHEEYASCWAFVCAARAHGSDPDATEHLAAQLATVGPGIRDLDRRTVTACPAGTAHRANPAATGVRAPYHFEA